MKLISTLLLAMSICLYLAGDTAGAASQPPVEGGELPEIILTVPPSAEHQQYLGITGTKSFTIPEIKAEVVLIEIYSMY